jgi:transposase InsO family protein
MARLNATLTPRARTSGQVTGGPCGWWSCCSHVTVAVEDLSGGAAAHEVAVVGSAGVVGDQPGVDLGAQLGVSRTKSRRVGYAYVHSAIDSYSCVAYSEVLDDETAATTIGFLQRAHGRFAAEGINVECVQNDNGPCYIAKAFRAAVQALGATHHRIPPRHPALNGKVERFHRTLADNWAYVRVYRSDRQRTQALDPWLHRYNYHRAHTAGGQPPMARVNNLAGHNT